MFLGHLFSIEVRRDRDRDRDRVRDIDRVRDRDRDGDIYWDRDPDRDFYKPRMVYARQTDDFVVKNIKKNKFLDIYDVITQNDVILQFFT